jgi:hypothetical protein
MKLIQQRQVVCKKNEDNIELKKAVFLKRGKRGSGSRKSEGFRINRFNIKAPEYKHRREVFYQAVNLLFLRKQLQF